ncbi:protein EARLY-RESPONSIVE TO DEHYDRATION 7, chloroplastic-like isoform X2 [Durio zibethinus]|uniref:Protein EARLY-RESPONSIVE TO DEHYDRATION 7, chloroplastic-like isoform X2 n=1 Tax=Durio zibethinus TaxID=66656 RepID=A0A6P6AE48_DURZI|nr:protein EARLY-RESPONSIVE TO DEHYDRATION 7, chloroplastic-like isoform X2 [Durio zibethinus]
MSSCPSKPSQNRSCLYPQVDLSNPDATSFYNSSSPSSSLYPSIDMKDLAENLFPEDDTVLVTHLDSQEQLLLKVPGAIVHLIERETSVQLACGELCIVSLLQGDNIVAVFVRIGDDIQWPLAKDEPVVKLDTSHYFFTLRVPSNGSFGDGRDCKQTEEVLNYGLAIAAKGQEGLLKELDRVLETYSCFLVQEVKGIENWNVVDTRNVAPEELEREEKRELIVGSSMAYWTTLAPNVEDYSGSIARAIASGSGFVVKGILWCGDVTVDRLKWGNEFLKKRMKPGSTSEISPGALRRMKRVKKLTKMSEKVATGILAGVVKVSGFFTSSIINSKVGKKFFKLLPGEIVLASLDGFNKVCDAVEVAGRNVMSTTSVVTTGLVSQSARQKGLDMDLDWRICGMEKGQDR